MSCDLFIRSYFRDFDWLVYCLAAIERFGSGFGVVVVAPQSSWAWLKKKVAFRPGVRFEVCQDYRDDYLGQQVTKLYADQYSDADWICHVDSDVLFTRPFTVDDLLVAGKARVLIRPVALLGRHKPWLQPTEAFLGEPVAFDYMQQPPFTFPRDLYAQVRRFCLARHGVELANYMLTRPPRGFSEFNALGAFAYRYHPEEFHWVDLSCHDPGPPLCRWYWSREGITPETREEIETILSQPAVVSADRTG